MAGILAFFSLASGVFVFAAYVVTGTLLYVTNIQRSNRQIIAIAIAGVALLSGIALTPQITHHVSLQAASIDQFMNALSNVFSWPFPEGVFFALLRNAPACGVVVFLILSKPRLESRLWFLFALIALMIGQAISIAYGRTTEPLSSRYQDLYAIGVLVNFVCLLALSQYDIIRPGLSLAAMTLWLASVSIATGFYASYNIGGGLMWRASSASTQQTNLRNYLATGKMSYLKDKPQFEIPYPNAERLISILTSTYVRTILPPSIRPPLIPTRIEMEPAQAFLKKGYSPGTPKLSDDTLGSFTTTGNAGTGKLKIHYPALDADVSLSIPVAGFPRDADINLNIEQRDQVLDIPIDQNPGESWVRANVKINGDHFQINVADASQSKWIAIGVPAIMPGRLDEMTVILLRHYYVFIMLGLVLGLALMALPLYRNPPGMNKRNSD